MTNDKFDTAERLRFLKLEARDTALLKELRKAIEPNISGILDRFYQHVLATPQLASMFPDQAMLQRARGAQERHWMGNVFNAEFGPAFMESVSRIGRAHVEIGLEPRWYMGGYCFTLNQLVDLACKIYRKKPEQLAEVLKAINKAVFLDMDLAISIYNDIGRDSILEMNREAQRFADEVKETVDAVAGASSELRSTADAMEKAASNTNSQAMSVAAAAEQASVNVQTVASAAEQLSSSVMEISRQVSHSESVSTSAVSEAQRTNEMVQGLANAAGRIGEVVNLINDIAAQTNLLALNATIEAARAGDAGKGFAVVASEVKNLANQTAKATEDISVQVGDIQSATKQAVEAIKSIGSTIGQISEISSTIATAVEEQSAATQEIARNVEQASAGTAEVSTHITEVTRTAVETGDAARGVLGQASDLTDRSGALRQRVDDFRDSMARHD